MFVFYFLYNILKIKVLKNEQTIEKKAFEKDHVFVF